MSPTVFIPSAPSKFGRIGRLVSSWRLAQNDVCETTNDSPHLSQLLPTPLPAGTWMRAVCRTQARNYGESSSELLYSENGWLALDYKVFEIK
jgi:hypothetical protein